MMALMTAAFLPPRSIAVAHAGASVNIDSAPAAAMSTPAILGFGHKRAAQHDDGRQQIGAGADCGAADAHAETAGERVGGHASGDIGDHAEKQRQAREDG